MVGLRCFLPWPTKKFSSQIGEKIERKKCDYLIDKNPMCFCTWEFVQLFFFILFSVFLCFKLDMIFFWTWFLFFNNLGDFFFLVVCHFFVLIGYHFFNKGIWVNLYIFFSSFHFSIPNQIKMREIKIFSILSLFYHSNQTNP